MFGFFFKGKLNKIVESDVIDARFFLSAIKLKLYKEGDRAVRLYADNVFDIADMLTNHFNKSIVSVISAYDIEPIFLDQISSSLFKGIENNRVYLKNSNSIIVNEALGRGVAASLFGYHYRLCFLLKTYKGVHFDRLLETFELYQVYLEILVKIALSEMEPHEAY